MNTHQSKPTFVEAHPIDKVMTFAMPDGEYLAFHTALGSTMSPLNGPAPVEGDYFIVGEGKTGQFAPKEAFEAAYEVLPVEVA